MLIAIAAFTAGLANEPLEAPAVKLGEVTHVHVEHVTAVQHVAPDHVRITLAFDVVTDLDFPEDIVLPIEIPRNAGVVGMKFELDGGTSVASFVWKEPAHAAYEDIVTDERDPALLEWGTTNETHHEMALHVFPVTAKSHARVTLELVAERVLPIPQAEQRIHKSKSARPMVGFGRQVGRKVSLMANDPGVGRPESTDF